jgi:hypothetical protein
VRAAVRPVVEAIMEALLTRELGPDSPSPPPLLCETVDDLMRKLFGMPQYLAVGMVGFTLAFDRASLFRHGRRFCALEIDQRLGQIERWKFSSIGPMRDFVSFYEKMGTFVFYSHLEESQ